MSLFENHFTVEEANALLPELRGLLDKVRAYRDQLVLDWEKAIPVLRAARMNGGGKEANPYLCDLQALNRELRRMAELGVQLKDVDRGLVDFPAWRDGKEVLLCWHLGEPEVAYWHDVESGYSGREPW
jgi:hypothetical protein